MAYSGDTAMRSVREKALAVKGSIHAECGGDESDKGEKLHHFGDRDIWLKNGC